MRANLFGLTLAIALLAAQAATGETFPGKPFNRLQLSYSISGLNLGPHKDKQDFTTSRTYKVEGVSGAVTVSGSSAAYDAVCLSDYGSFWFQTDVSLTVDGKRVTFHSPEPCNREGAKERYSVKQGVQQFNLTLPAKPDSAVSFSIRQTYVNPRFGDRTVAVGGSIAAGDGADDSKPDDKPKSDARITKLTACPADPSGQGALIPNWRGFPARFDIEVEGDDWKRLRWKQSDEDEAHEIALDEPWVNIMAYDNGADDKQPARKVDKTITVEVLDDEGKVLDSRTLPYRVGLGLAYTHAKLILVNTEPSRLATHALVLTVASDLRPGMDVGAWFEDYDTCRKGERVRFQPDIKVNLRPEVLIGPNEVFGAPVKLQVYRGPLAFARLNDKEAVLVVDGIMPVQVGKGGGGPQHQSGKHRYPGVALAVTGEYSFMTALRPHVGSSEAWDFGDLTQDLFYTATFEPDPSWQQLYACMFEAHTTQQVVLRETLKLMPVYGSGISWGFTAFSSLCAYSKGNYDKSFLTIMKKIGEVAAEKMIFSQLTKAIGEVPDLSADDKAGLVEGIKTMYKIAKANYKIWAGNNGLSQPSPPLGGVPESTPPGIPAQSEPTDGGWQTVID